MTFCYFGVKTKPSFLKLERKDQNNNINGQTRIIKPTFHGVIEDRDSSGKSHSVSCIYIYI